MTSRVTTKDLYDELREFRKEVMEMSEKAEARCVKRFEAVAAEVETNSDFRKEIKTKITTYSGIATIIGGVIVFIGDRLWDIFTKKL